MTSRMFDEAREAPAAVARLMAADLAAYTSLGEQLRADPPRSALTVARGSSDHAAHYMAYLVMARLGQLVTSLPMSIVSVLPASVPSARRTPPRHLVTRWLPRL